MGKTVAYEIADEVAVVTMDNPPVNAFTRTFSADFLDTFKALRAEKLRAVVVTGTGRAFQGGADITMFLDLKSEEDGAAIGKMTQGIMNSVAGIECPVIAAINGFATGGGTELAIACDIRIASSKAVFGQPEVAYGVLPGAGGTQRLPRLIGPGRAKLLIFSGKKVSAEEAFQIGLVDLVVEPEQLLPEAMKLARKIAGNSPAAVRFCKWNDLVRRADNELRIRQPFKHIIRLT